MVFSNQIGQSLEFYKYSVFVKTLEDGNQCNNLKDILNSVWKYNKFLNPYQVFIWRLGRKTNDINVNPEMNKGQSKYMSDHH